MNENQVKIENQFPKPYFIAGILDLVFSAFGILFCIWLSLLPSRLSGMHFPYNLIATSGIFKKIVLTVIISVLSVDIVLITGGILLVLKKYIGKIVAGIGAILDIAMKIFFISFYAIKILPALREIIFFIPKPGKMWIFMTPGVIVFSIILAIPPLLIAGFLSIKTINLKRNNASSDDR